MSERMMDKINLTIREGLNDIGDLLIDIRDTYNSHLTEQNIHLYNIAETLKIIASKKEDPKAKTVKKK